MSEHEGAGWATDFPRFEATEPRVVRISLQDFVGDASPQQVAAWDDSIPRLQTEVGEVLEADPPSRTYSAILEYRLPLEARRADAVFLVAGAVVVIELKGAREPTQAAIDQAAAYARDLHAYHRECQNRPVHAVLVPTASAAEPEERDGVWITGPTALDGLVLDLTARADAPSPDLAAFLDASAYCPLPSLVEAARELFFHGEVREIWRARAATDPAVERVAQVAREAAATDTRHLVLVRGVPGSGKTLVGLRSVHAGFLDDLAVERANGMPSVPALFLSGNGPLVQVLQHVLRKAGGGGRTFVRHIKDYLDAHVPREQRIPPEHLLVFDEAQRAFSADMVGAKHPKWPQALIRSEPQLFVDLCERMPGWSVLVGLIGTGQEIHLGEEGGVGQWCDALESSRQPERWTVHAPAELEEVFQDSSVSTVWEPTLNLDTELRYHVASDLHLFVTDLLESKTRPDAAGAVADRLWSPRGRGLAGMRLWATRDLEHAKSYLRERYAEDPHARFGLLASSRDKSLVSQGVDNSWQATRLVRLGPWFADGEEGVHSCRHLRECVTEFGAQGLELDMVLLAWGTDFVRKNGRWSIDRARGYRPGNVVLKDPYRLRVNAYRVLLTRGRDGLVVFVPPLPELDETWRYLLAQGFRALPGNGDSRGRPEPPASPRAHDPAQGRARYGS